MYNVHNELTCAYVHELVCCRLQKAYTDINIRIVGCIEFVQMLQVADV
jgi:hypothetical protein